MITLTFDDRTELSRWSRANALRFAAGRPLSLETVNRLFDDELLMFFMKLDRREFVDQTLKEPVDAPTN